LSFLKQLSGVLSASLLATGFSALTGILVARALGPSGHGVYTTITAAASFSLLVLTMGTGVALRLRSKGAPSPSLQAGFAAFTVAMLPFAGAACLIVSWLAFRTLEPLLIVLVVGYGAATFVLRQGSEAVQALGRVGASQAGSAVSGGVSAIAALGVLTIGFSVVEAALCAVLLGQIFQGLFYLAILAPRYRGQLVRCRDAFAAGAALARDGLPNVGYGLGTFGLQRADRLVLALLAGPASVGIYAAAVSLAELSRILSTGLGQYLFVIVSRSGLITRRARYVRWTALAIQGILCMTLAAFAEPVVVLLYGPDFSASSALLRILLVGEFFMGSSIIESRIAIGRGRVKVLSTSTIVVGVAAVASYVVAGFAGGAIALAVACACSYFVFWAVSARIAHRQRPFESESSAI
jgi:O-antigen/teichoic acid export membrane protein